MYFPTPRQRMQSIGSHWLQQHSAYSIKPNHLSGAGLIDYILLWQQLNAFSVTRPSFCKECGLQDEKIAMFSCSVVTIYPCWQHSYLFVHHETDVVYGDVPLGIAFKVCPVHKATSLFCSQVVTLWMCRGDVCVGEGGRWTAWIGGNWGYIHPSCQVRRYSGVSCIQWNSNADNLGATIFVLN